MPFDTRWREQIYYFFIAADRLHYFVKVSCNYFKRTFDNVDRMNMNYEHSSISGKNISSFGRNMTEIFKIFFVELLTGHPMVTSFEWPVILSNSMFHEFLFGRKVLFQFLCKLVLLLTIDSYVSHSLRF